MNTEAVIDECKETKDYFPALFVNKDNSIIILADERTSDKTFSGMIIHSTNHAKMCHLGSYSTGWTYQQFRRLPKHSKVTIDIEQND